MTDRLCSVQSTPMSEHRRKGREDAEESWPSGRQERSKKRSGAVDVRQETTDDRQRPVTRTSSSYHFLLLFLPSLTTPLRFEHHAATLSISLQHGHSFKTPSWIKKSLRTRLYWLHTIDTGTGHLFPPSPWSSFGPAWHAYISLSGKTLCPRLAGHTRQGGYQAKAYSRIQTL